VRAGHSRSGAAGDNLGPTNNKYIFKETVEVQDENSTREHSGNLHLMQVCQTSVRPAT